MESALDSFQGRVARQLTGRQPCRGRDGEWFYPSLAGALKEAGVVRARTLVLRRQNTVRNLLRHDQFWGSVRWKIGGRGHESHSDGGSSRESIGGWRGRRRQRQRQRLRREQTRQRRRHRDWDRKRNQTQPPLRGGPRAAPGRRRPWESVVPVGRSGSGRRIELIGRGLKQDNVVPK